MTATEPDSNRAASETASPWLLPTEIAFPELKGKRLEECVFWLPEGMGAREIEWRIGGTGAGAADGGRDIEARFFAPDADGTVEPHKWWIECKGRSGTLEKEAVTAACTNAVADASVEVLVIVTNTTFSNPTRDWVKVWATRFAKPKVLLWDHMTLERLLGQQPATVLRLFEGALSSAGYLEALRERFWNLLEYSSIRRLKRIWDERDTIEIGAMDRVALIANEFAHGSIDERPWAGTCAADDLFETFRYALLNLVYLYLRITRFSADERPIVQTLAYLVASTARHVDSGRIIAVFCEATQTDDGEPMPEEVVEHLLMPIVDTLLSDLQTVCTSDCPRFSRRDSFKSLGRPDPLASFWWRFSREGMPAPPDAASAHRLENLREPCLVGFDMNEFKSCPLYSIEPRPSDLAPFLDVAAQIVRRRSRAVSARLGKG